MLFCFLDGLSPQLQAFVRMQRPHDLQNAMQIAEQIGSILVTAHVNNRVKGKRHVAVPVMLK